MTSVRDSTAAASCTVLDNQVNASKLPKLIKFFPKTAKLKKKENEIQQNLMVLTKNLSKIREKNTDEIVQFFQI